MTEAKPAEFAKGDQVTSQDGVKLVVINQGSPGGAVHAETAPGVKPYKNTHYAADSLKKATAKKAPAPKGKKDDPKPPPANVPGDYMVNFKRADSELTYEVAIEGADSEADAIAKAKADGSHSEGDELLGLEKVEA